MFCAKFGWNCTSGSGEEDEYVKSLQTDGRTDDGRQEIWKDELKKTNKPKITRMVKNRFRAKVWQLIYILTWWNELFCIFRIISYLYKRGSEWHSGISLTSDNWSYNLSYTLSWELMHLTKNWLKHCGFALGISIFIIWTLRERE